MAFKLPTIIAKRKIKKLRTKSGVDRYEFAKNINISMYELDAIESEKSHGKRLDWDTVVKICDELDVSLDELRSI